jgi:hypothetical protein
MTGASAPLEYSNLLVPAIHFGAFMYSEATSKFGGFCTKWAKRKVPHPAKNEGLSMQSNIISASCSL